MSTAAATPPAGAGGPTTSECTAPHRTPLALVPAAPAPHLVPQLHSHLLRHARRHRHRRHAPAGEASGRSGGGVGRRASGGWGRPAARRPPGGRQGGWHAAAQPSSSSTAKQQISQAAPSSTSALRPLTAAACTRSCPACRSRPRAGTAVQFGQYGTNWAMRLGRYGRAAGSSSQRRRGRQRVATGQPLSGHRAATATASAATPPTHTPHLRYLGRLAAAGLSHDDDDLAVQREIRQYSRQQRGQ